MRCLVTAHDTQEGGPVPPQRPSLRQKNRSPQLFCKRLERLWRSLKYEAVYLHEIADGFTARRLIGEWLRFYNVERPHSALDGRTPAEAYRGDPPVDMMDKPLRALPTSPQAQQQQKEDRSKGILAA